MRISIFILVVIIVWGCRKDPPPSKSPMVPDFSATPYDLYVPPGFPKLNPDIVKKLSKEGVFLGKKLYFDPILSENGLSCSSCHIPDKSFSLPLYINKKGEAISVPPHINLIYKTFYNWSGSVGCLDTLPYGDFTADFFNTQFELLRNRIKNHAAYPALFLAAFGISDIDSCNDIQLRNYITNALVQYLRSRLSYQAKIDQYRYGKVVLSKEEMAGLIIYQSEKGDCFHCHPYPLLTDNQFHNNGLNDTYFGQDSGRSRHTGFNHDLGKFVTPTLRNIVLTAPYMHDGRYKTLEAVIDFYNQGVHSGAEKDPLMTKADGGTLLHLTSEDKKNLLAFLKTFTDTAFLIP